MTFYELYSELDHRFPKSLSCDWDNDGIMCADDLKKSVKKVLISLDVTSDTVGYAIKNSFDTIISHHPLVFHSQKALCPLNYTQDKLIRLIKSGVGVMSFHTRLDAAKGGVNDTLAELVGFSHIESDPEEPIGRICFLDGKAELSAFAEKVKKALSAPTVLFSGTREVSKVYVVGGDGKDMIPRAIECGVDTLLTGRASYNTAADAADMGLNIVEAGHYFTENPVCRMLEKTVLSLDPRISTEIYDSNRITAI